MYHNPFMYGSQKGTKDVITDFLQTVVLALAFSLILYLVFLVPSIVDGSSMEPNFWDKNLLFANKVIQWLGPTNIGQKYNYDYKRGDVIIFQLGDKNLIKRIIAVGGDTVKIYNGIIYINGKEIVESYLPVGRKTEMPVYGVASFDENETITVPSDSYFVLGDNRPVSQDSRYSAVGFVKRKQIRGKVFIKYWPLNQFEIIKRGEYIEK